MASMNGTINFEVNPVIQVDKHDAKMMLYFVESYVNNTGDDIIAHKNENGKLKFWFKSDEGEAKHETD